MNRLRDDAGEDPVTEKGIKLLRGTPAALPPTDLKRRVWMSLQEAEGRSLATFRLSRLSGAPRMKAFALVATIVCVAGSAGAVIVGRWIEPRRTDAGSAADSIDVKTATKRKTARIGKIDKIDKIGSITSLKVTPPMAPEPKAVEPAPPEVRTPPPIKAQPVRSTGGIAARAQRPSASVPGPVSSSASGVPAASGASMESMASIGAAGARERTEVLDALVALRRDHDPVRAGVLLDRYLAAHPDGVLHEEALVLAIEAAAGRGDHPSARGYARTYEADHPKGRFRQFARSHAQSQTQSIHP